MPSFLKAWAPVILWSAFIFYLSTDTFSSANTSQVITPLLLSIFSSASPDLVETVHDLIRNLAHWTEYFIWASLVIRAFRRDKGREWKRRWIHWTMMMVLFYALSDEFHQMFVPSRTPLLRDVMLDVFGGACGVFWMYLRQRKYRSCG